MSGREAGVVDCSHGKTSSVTRRDRGGGCSTPSPSAPPPRGRFPTDTVSWDLAVSSRSHLTLLKDPLSAHGTATEPIAMHCPPPLEGREEAAERPGGGGVSAKGGFSDTRAAGRRGCFPEVKNRSR